MFKEMCDAVRNFDFLVSVYRHKLVIDRAEIGGEDAIGF
jgi:hypothetical protein